MAAKDLADIRVSDQPARIVDDEGMASLADPDCSNHFLDQFQVDVGNGDSGGSDSTPVRSPFGGAGQNSLRMVNTVVRLVSEVVPVKHPMTAGIPAQRGVEF